MAYYSVTSSFPIGDNESRTFARRDAAADYAYAAIYAQFEAQGLLDRPAAWNAIRQLPADLRSIPVDPVDGRRILRIDCGYQRAVTINAGSSRGTMAAALAARVRGMSAWNHTREERNQIRRARRNGWGLRLTFADGSGAFIPTGTSAVRVVA